MDGYEELGDGARAPEGSYVGEKVKKYARVTAVLGLLVAVASPFLAILLSQSVLLNGILVGVGITMVSGLLAVLERGLVFRRLLGAVMVLVPIVPMYFGGPPILPVMYLPGLIIGAFMLKSRRRGIRSSLLVLIGAVLYACVWLIGLVPGALLEGSWIPTMTLLWYTRVPEGAPSWPFGTGFISYLWAMQFEKALALVAGLFLLLTSLTSRPRPSSSKTTYIALAASLLPLLLLMPPPRTSIEGSSTLTVKVLDPFRTPLTGIEIDLAQSPVLPPPLGGSSTTDHYGIATFHVKPGGYFVYFDSRWFPPDYDYPSQQYTVNVTGEASELTIPLNYSKTPIVGTTVLRISVTTTDGKPVTNLEVDIGRQPGPPPEGGKTTTDSNGTATFHIKPGRYCIYFNLNNFPTSLEYPTDITFVEVSDGKQNESTLVLRYKMPSR